MSSCEEALGLAPTTQGIALFRLGVLAVLMVLAPWSSLEAAPIEVRFAEGAAHGLVLVRSGVTGWAALECLLCDWADRGGDGHPVRRPPPSPSGKPGGPGVGQVGPVHASVQPVQVIGSDLRNSSPFFRRPPTR